MVKFKHNFANKVNFKVKTLAGDKQASQVELSWKKDANFKFQNIKLLGKPNHNSHRGILDSNKLKQPELTVYQNSKIQFYKIFIS